LLISAETVADIEGEIDTKQETDLKDVRVEFTTKPIEEKPIGVESSTQSETVVEKKVEFEEITERGLEVSDEDSDILGRLDSSSQGSSAGISFPAESGDAEEVAEVPEKTKKEDLDIPSGVKEDINAEEGEQVASSEVTEENVLAVDDGDTADFDIQEFLEELENLPSEKDPETEK
jgi:hypothetical protein